MAGPFRASTSEHEQSIANDGSSRIRRVANHRVSVDRRFGADPATAPQLPVCLRAFVAHLPVSFVVGTVEMLADSSPAAKRPRRKKGIPEEPDR